MAQPAGSPQSEAVSGENRLSVADEPVEFEE